MTKPILTYNSSPPFFGVYFQCHLNVPSLHSTHAYLPSSFWLLISFLGIRKKEKKEKKRTKEITLSREAPIGKKKDVQICGHSMGEGKGGWWGGRVWRGKASATYTPPAKANPPAAMSTSILSFKPQTSKRTFGVSSFFVPVTPSLFNFSRAPLMAE